jgi:hypothetical protein
MGMSELDIEMQEVRDLNFDIDSEYSYLEFQEAMDYLEIFGKIIQNEDEYADYVTATTKIEEYQSIVTLHTTNESFNEEVIHQIQTLQATIIELSDKLKATEENIPLTDKKLITVKDFEKLYSISDESQRKLRKRLSDPLPFIQIEKRGNVLYNHKEVDKWFENYTNEGR